MTYRKKQIFIYFVSLIVLCLFFSCSSTTEVEKNEKEVRYKSKPEKVIKSLDLVEREFISTSKIKTIEKVSFELTPAGKPINGEKYLTQNYNPKGFLIETITYNSDGTIQYKYNYTYDNNGTRIKTTRYDSSGKMTNYYKYDYNEFGNKVKAYSYVLDGNLEEYYTYEYDGDGNLIEEKWFSPLGDEVYNIETDYDNGIKTHTYTYDENGDLIYEYVFRYDEKGNIIEETKYNSNGLQVGIIQYVYKYH